MDKVLNYFFGGGQERNDINPGYQSNLATLLQEFFISYWDRPCPLGEGHKRVKGIFKAFDDQNTHGWFSSGNENFDKDIFQTVKTVEVCLDPKNQFFLGNFHIIIYTALRIEQEFHYLPKRMPQEVKDELTYSIPTLIDEILKDGPLFHTAHESLNYIRGQFYEEYVSDILKLIKEHTQNYGENALKKGLIEFEVFLQAFSIIIQTNYTKGYGRTTIDKSITETWISFLNNISKTKSTDVNQAIFKLNKYIDLFDHENPSTGIILDAYKSRRAETALLLSITFNFYPRVDYYGSFKGDLTNAIKSRKFKKHETLAQWWVTLLVVYESSEKSKIYFDALNVVNSAIIFSDANITTFCKDFAGIFEFTRTNVEDLRQTFDNIEEIFKKRIMNYLTYWITTTSKSSKWELTYNKLKQLAEFASGELRLTEAQLKDIFDTGNFNRPQEQEFLFSLFGNGTGGTPQEGVMFQVRTFLDIAKTKYQRNPGWDKDPILDSIFFPSLHPKLCDNLSEENLNDIREHIKGLNIHLSSFLYDFKKITDKERSFKNNFGNLDVSLCFMDGFAYNIVRSCFPPTEALRKLDELQRSSVSAFLIMLFKALCDYLRDQNTRILDVYQRESITNILGLTGYKLDTELKRRAHEQYMKSLDLLKDNFRDELFEMFDGKVTQKQAESIKTANKSYRLAAFCEMLGLKNIAKEGEVPKLLPKGVLFKNAGVMIGALFTRLEEKSKELNTCSKWLRDMKLIKYTYNQLWIRNDTTLDKIKKGIEEVMEDMYPEDKDTFDKEKQATLVDIVSYMLRINSVLFINNFKGSTIKDLNERFYNTKKELIELFNPDKVTLKQLGELKSTVKGIDNLSDEINKIVNAFISKKPLNISVERIVAKTVNEYSGDQQNEGDINEKIEGFDVTKAIQSAVHLVELKDLFDEIKVFMGSFEGIIDRGSVDAIRAILMEKVTDDLKLNEAPGILDEMDANTGGLRGGHTKLFESLARSSDVLTFLKEFSNKNDFEKTMNTIRENITGNDFGIAAINSLINLYGDLEILVVKKGIALQEFSKNFNGDLAPEKVDEKIKHTIESVENANIHLGDIKLWIAIVMSSEPNIDFILPHIEEVEKNGTFLIHVEGQRKPSLSLIISRERVKTEMHVQHLTEFIHGMRVFTSKEGIDKEGVKKIENYIRVNSFSRKIWDVFCDLKEHGHPGYQSDLTLNEKGHFYSQTFEGKLKFMKDELEKWKRDLSNAETDEPYMIFLNHAQIFQFGNTIKSIEGVDDAKIANALRPFAWLCFPDSEDVIPEEKLVEAYNECKKSETLISCIKVFIGTIKKSVEREAIEEKDFEGVKVVKAVEYQSEGKISRFTENDIFKYLVDRFGKRVHPSLVFRCSEKSTQRDLKRFLSRTTAFPGLRYALIDVNLLNSEAREELLGWYSDMLGDGTKSTAETFLIFTEYEGLEHFDANSIVELSKEDTQIAQDPREVRSPQIKSLIIYDGREMCGKSHEIQLELNRFRQKISINIAEDFTPSKFIRAMDPILLNPSEIGIHFKVSPYSPLKLFGRFFNTLASWYTLNDETTGEIKSIPGNVEMSIYMEVEGAPEDDKECECYTTESVTKMISGLDFMRTRVVSNIPREYVLKQDELGLAHWFCGYKSGRMNSVENGYKLLCEESSSDTEKNDFAKYLKSLTGDIAIQSRIVGLYRIRYEGLKDHLANLCDTIKAIRATGDRFNPNQYVNPDVYCRIFDEEVRQLVKKNVTMMNLHLNWTRDGFTPINFTGINFTGIIKGYDKLEEKTKENQKTSSDLRHCLSTAFGDSGISDIIQQHGYALTPDFVIKLLTLNDFRRARKTVVVSGDTGTGKTEILTILSELINKEHSIVPDMFNEIGSSKEIGFIKGAATNLKELCDNAKKVEDKDIDSFRVNLAKFTFDIVNRFQLITPSELMEKVLKCFTAQGNYDAERGKEALKTKEDLVKLVGELGKPKFKGIFFKIMMHQHLNGDDFRAEIKKIEDAAKELKKSNATVVAFIDECTSTSIMGLVKEVLSDRMLDGKPLSDNVMWIGAFNRNKSSEVEEASDAFIRGYTRADEKHTADFEVRPPPKSFEYAEMKFEEMSGDDLNEFLTRLLELRDELGISVGKGEEQRNALKDVIIKCYNLLKGYNVHRVHMSIRDIMRCIGLYTYFQEHRNLLPKKWDGGNEDQWAHYSSVALATAIAFYFRLPEKAINKDGNPVNLRKQFLDDLKFESFKLGAPDRVKYGVILREAEMQLFNNTEIPKGIAPTKALLENLFCTVVSIDARVPLIIVGPPGCSKTLSFKIAIDNMKGRQSVKDLYKTLCYAHPFRYQCSTASTDKEIEGVYRSAETQQKSYNKTENQESIQRCVVMLDEAGLPNEEKAPLKILHYKLDHPVVSSVLLSNNVLDAAKTNRVAMLVQDTDGNDLEELAWGCVFGKRIDDDKELKKMISGVCNAFKVIQRGWYEKDKAKKKICPIENYFHLRDFVYFLRYLSREQKKTGNCFTQSSIEHAARRNFGGLLEAEFRELLDIFFGKLGFENRCEDGSYEPQTDTIQSLKENMAEKISEDEDPNIAPFRDVMILDSTDNEASIFLLYKLGVCSHENTVVVHVADFEEDATEEAKSNAVLNVKEAMTEGKTVVMLNALPISTSFYDVFNRHFDLIPVNGAEGEDDGKRRFQYFANIAIGAYSRPCVVHPNFRVIVHVPVSALPQTPAPFLNRFEKYRLSLHSLLQDKLVTLNDDQRSVIQMLRRGCQDMIKNLHTAYQDGTFFGLVPEETLNSLLLMIAEDMSVDDIDYRRIIPKPLYASEEMLDEDTKPYDQDDNGEGRILVRALNFFLFQLGRPEGILSCNALPDTYRREYVVRQEHFSFLRLLNIVGKKVGTTSQKLCVFTRTSGEFSQLRNYAPQKDGKRYTNAVQDEIQKAIMLGRGHEGEEKEENIFIEYATLSQFSSSRKCEKFIKSFMANRRKEVLLCAADMKLCSSDQVNFIRKQIDAYNTGEEKKTIVLIIHFPPEMLSLKSSKMTSAVFVNNWNFTYVDSFGMKVTENEEGAEAVLELDPRAWLAHAYRLDAGLDMSNVKDVLWKRLVDQARSWVSKLNIPRTKADSLSLAKVFYSNPKKANERRAMPAKRAKIIEDMFEKQEYVTRGIMSHLVKMWCNRLLRDIVKEACDKVNNGEITSGILVTIQDVMEKLLIPVVNELMKTLCDNYNLEAIMNIENEDRTDEENKRTERKLVKEVLENIKILSEDVLKTALSGNPTIKGAVSISQDFPPYLPMYNVIENRILDLIKLAKAEEREDNRSYSRLAEKLSEIIKGDWISEVATLIGKSEHLLSLLKRDIIASLMKNGGIHVSLKTVGKNANIESGMKVLEKILDNATDGNPESVGHLFLAASMKKEHIGYMVKKVSALRFCDMNKDLINVPPIDDNNTDFVDKYFLQKGIEGMWKLLDGWLKGNNALVASFANTYRMTLAQECPRYALFHTILDAGEFRFKYDVINVVGLFLTNTLITGVEPFEGVKAGLEKFGMNGDSALSLEKAFEFAEVITERESPALREALLEDTAYKFLTYTPGEGEKPGNAVFNDLPTLLNAISTRKLSPVWGTNFLYEWASKKPIEWQTNLLTMLEEHQEAKLDKFDFLNTTLEALKPVVFVHFHLLKSLLEDDDNENRAKELSKNPNLVVSAAAIAALIRSAAQAISDSKLGSFDASVLDILKAVPKNPRFVNLDEYFLCAIPSEEKCLKFITNRDELLKCGMEHRFINKAVNVDLFNLPVFMSVKDHPLYGEYMNMKSLLEKPGNEFVTGLRQKIEKEPNGERKTRMKCIIKMLIVASLYYDFFCKNRSCGNLSSKLGEITPIIGLKEKEKNAIFFLNRGWYNVQDLDMDCFLTLFSKQKREKNDKDAKEWASFFVNVLIYGLGCYEDSNFIYPRIFEIKRMQGTYCPGSSFSRQNRDCGFKIMQGGNGFDIANPLTPSDIMGGNTQYRLALNAMVWAAFTWSYVLDETGSFEYTKTSSPQLMNYALATDGYDSTLKYGHDRTKTRDIFHAYKEYSYERACGFYCLILLNNDITGRKGIISSHYINESLDELWMKIDCNECPSKRNGALKSIYASQDEAINYENQMKLVFDAVSGGYNNRKKKLQDAISNNDAALLNVTKNRQNYSLVMDTPIVSWTYVNDKMMNIEEAKEAYELLLEIGSKEGEIAVLSFVPLIIHFYYALVETCDFRLPREAASGITMKDVIAKYDKEGKLGAIWEEFKRNWAIVKESTQEQGCNAQNRAENEIVEISDDTLLCDIIEIADDVPNGVIKTLRDGMGKLQDNTIEKIKTRCGNYNKLEFLFPDNEEITPEALYYKSNRNFSLLQCSGITKARAHVSTFIKCADNMRRDSIKLDWKRYIVDAVQRVGSSAASFSSTIDHVWETRINFLGDKSLAEVRESRTENTKGLNVKTIVDCDEFILTKKLEEFEPYKKGYDVNAKRFFENASVEALKEASKVITQLVSFVIDWTKDENDYQKNIKENEDFDDFGPMLTIEAAYEKITRKRFGHNVLSRDFSKAELSGLHCIATEIADCLKTKSWLFNDSKSISGKLPDDIVKKLEKVEQDLLEDCEGDLEKTNNLGISIDKISGTIMKKIKDARKSKSDKSISSLIGNKGSEGNENIMKLVLPEEIKTSCYKEYMMWLYKLLFKVKMILFNNKYVPRNEDDEDKDTLLKGNTFYSELVDRTRIIEEIKQSSPDNNKDEDEEAFNNKEKAVLIYNYDDNSEDNFKNDDAPNDVETQDDDTDDFKIKINVSSIKPKAQPIPGTQPQSSQPSILNNPFDSMYKSQPPQFIFGVTQPQQKPQQGPYVPTPPKYEPKPPSQPFNPPSMFMPPQPQQQQQQQPQQWKYTPTPPRYEPKPPSSQPFNPPSMFIPPQPQQQQQQQQPQQGPYTPAPPKYEPRPPSQPFNPPSMFMPPQPQQQQPQQWKYTPTPPKHEPIPPSSQPFNPPSMPMQPPQQQQQQPQQGPYTPTPQRNESIPPSSQPFNPPSMPMQLQQQQQQQPQQGPYTPTPQRNESIPPSSQPFNPPSMPMQPQQQQQQQEVPIGYQPQAMQQHPQGVAPFPQVKQQSAFVPQPHTFGPGITKKVFAKSTFVPPKHVFKS